MYFSVADENWPAKFKLPFLEFTITLVLPVSNNKLPAEDVWKKSNSAFTVGKASACIEQVISPPTLK